jgi:manganese efflux pump family protein
MYTLWQAWRESKEQTLKAEDNHPMHFSRLMITGLALSIDNLVIGFALSFSHVPLLLAAAIIALVSVGMSLVGLELGKHLGKRIEDWSEVFSGVILILVGLAVGGGLF